VYNLHKLLEAMGLRKNVITVCSIHVSTQTVAIETKQLGILAEQKTKNEKVRINNYHRA